MSRRSAGHRVLVVEDEYYLAQDLAFALAAAGVAVVGPVPTVEDALQLLAEMFDPHGAVLDVNLGGEQVYPLADELRARGIPLVFLTGYDCANLPPRFEEDVCLEKPIDAGVVVARIVEVMERRSATPSGGRADPS